jgi:hypothetical protein
MPARTPVESANRSAGAERLLPLLLRPGSADGLRSRIEPLVAAGPDWGLLGGRAATELVSPLVHVGLDGIAGVPPRFREAMRQGYLQSDARTTRSIALLFEALDALERAGIDVVSLKGPVLAHELLGDPALLPAVDLDFLVRRARLRAALDCLAGIGFRPHQEVDEAYLATFVEVELAGAPWQPPLELHFRLGHHRHFPVPDEFWWGGVREISFHGRAVRVPSRDRSVLFAALHLFKHSFDSLRHLVGFAAMLRVWRDALDWGTLFADAARFRADKALLVSAALAAALFEPPLPPVVRERLDRLSARERHLVEATARDLLHGRRRSRAAVRARVLLLQHGTLGGLRLLSRWAVPPVEEVRLRYRLPRGSRRLWAYYLLNPILLLRRRHL